MVWSNSVIRSVLYCGRRSSDLAFSSGGKEGCGIRILKCLRTRVTTDLRCFPDKLITMEMVMDISRQELFSFRNLNHLNENETNCQGINIQLLTLHETAIAEYLSTSPFPLPPIRSSCKLNISFPPPLLLKQCSYNYYFY